MSNEICAKVKSIIDDASISFSVSYLCPRKRDGWDCNAWLVKFTGDRSEEFEFFTGLGFNRNSLHVADVLHSLILDSSANEMSFDDWCLEYGYSSDSIKARDTYDACQRNTDKLCRIFPRKTLEALRETLQDY